MTTPQGCERCRTGWYSGDRSPYVSKGIVKEMQSEYYRCRYCGTWWQDSPLGRPGICAEADALRHLGREADDPLSDIRDEVEALIASGSTEEHDRVRLITLLIRSVLVLPSSTPADLMAQVTPVMFPPAANPSVTVFTTADGAARVAHSAPYQLTISGFDLVMYLAPGMGLAVAGKSGVTVFDPHLLGLVKQDLLTRGER